MGIRRTGLKVAVLMVSAVLALTACSSKSAAPAADPAKPAAGQPAAQAPAEHKKLKVGYLMVMDDAQAMLAKDAGYYDKQGLDVDLVMFSSGTDLIKALVGGKLDAGVLGFTNAIAWTAQGADLKVVGGAQMGYHSILVRKGSGIKSVADLKGKKLASQKPGTTADIVLTGVVLPQAGLTKNDVTMDYVEPQVAIQALEAGKVDAAFVFEPYDEMAQATADVERVYEVGKVWPFPCMVVITSGKELQTDREAINRLLTAQKDAIGMLQNQPADAAKLLAKRFIQDDKMMGTHGPVPAVDVIQKAIQSQSFQWAITPDQVKRMGEIADIMTKQGILKSKVDVNSSLDLSWQNSLK